MAGDTSEKVDARLRSKSSILWIVMSVLAAVATIVFFTRQSIPISKPDSQENSSPVTENHTKAPHREKKKGATPSASPHSSQPKSYKSDQERIAERLHAVESGASLAPAPIFNQGTE